MRGFLAESGGNAFRLAFVGMFAGLQCKIERMREVKHWTNWALAGVFTGGVLGLIETRNPRQIASWAALGATVGGVAGALRPRLGLQDVT
jgi:hypothetical protein